MPPPEAKATPGEGEAYGLWAERRPELLPAFGRSLPSCVDGGLAVFDADGTLWTNDVADDFTLWMIRQGHIPGELWSEYSRIYRDDHPAGCRYLLRLYTGLHILGIRARVDEWWLHHARRQWIPQVVETLRHAADLGYPVWIVSGTPTDFLLPLLRMLPVSEIVGMDFDLDGSGKVTGRHRGISCAGDGKAEKIRVMARGKAVALCCGNGSLDGPMMEMASIAWSVYPNPEFEQFCRQRGWPILPRPSDFVEEQKFAT